MQRQDFEPFLRLSKNHPRFKYSIENLKFELVQSLNAGKITRTEYEEISGKLGGIEIGIMGSVIDNALIWFNRILNKGFQQISFTEEQFRELLEAKKTAVDFFKWVDIRNHKRDNEALMGYIRNLAQQTLEFIKNEDDRVWDVYSELKNVVVTTLSRDLILRTKIVPIVKIIMVLMKEEYKIKKEQSKKFREVKFMNFFEENIEDIEGMDPDELSLELMELYLTNLPKFDDRYREIYSIILSKGREGKITQDQVEMYITEITKIKQHAVATNIAPYEPLSTYYYQYTRNLSLNYCLIYTETQINRSLEFARILAQGLNNNFFIKHMVGEKLNINLENYGYSREVKVFLMNTLKANLALLRSYEIITPQQHQEYLNLGWERFK